MRAFRSILAGLAWLTAAGAVPSEPAAAEPGAPVVVELFTSQGCSSCPPADALLHDLAARGDVIPLSLHVDYWDYIGWKDPFASPMNTERQQNYADTLGLPYVFTPQIVIDGTVSVVGSHRGEVLAAIERARAQEKPLKVRFVTEGGGRVLLPAGPAPEVGATVWVAVYDRSQQTAVKRGENAGRTIHNANVVRRFERLGTWIGEALEIPLNLDGPGTAGRDGCAVIVQEGRTGRVLGAAAMPMPLEN